MSNGANNNGEQLIRVVLCALDETGNVSPLKIINGVTQSNTTIVGITGVNPGDGIDASVVAGILEIAAKVDATTIDFTGLGEIEVKNLGITNAKIANGTIDLTAKVTGALPIANGGTGQTAQTPAFDALAPTTTQGDMIYHNGTDNVRLPKGIALYILAMNAGATAPEWVPAPTSGAPTDATYITQTPNASLSNEQALSLLTTGIMRVATGTGVITSLGDVLPIANGGLNNTTAPAVGYIPFSDTTSSFIPRAISGILSKSSAYTVVAADANKVVLADASSAAFTITLDDAATLGAGFVITIIKTNADTITGTNAVTIACGGYTINGASTNILQAQYSHVSLISTGSGWSVLSAQDTMFTQVNTPTSFPTSGQFGDNTSLTIPPGNWQISINLIAAFVAGVVNAVATGIGNATGNDASGLAIGTYAQTFGPTVITDVFCGVPSRSVVFTSATTRYAKVLATYTTTAPTYQITMTATRVK